MTGPTGPVIPVAEVRDYRRINLEIERLLRRGHARIVLNGVDRQRLLVSGLAGPWSAVVEVEGNAGPELGADLRTPHLRVIVRGATADGLARGLQAGRVLVLGDAGDLAGCEVSGGVVAVMGDAGHRAGLRQRGGLIAIRGRVGRLAGERQSGGRLWVGSGMAGPAAGFARSGGAFSLGNGGADDEPDLRALLDEADRWLAQSRSRAEASR